MPEGVKYLIKFHCK